MIFLISDIHGYSFDRIQGLLNKASFTNKDYLFVLGDVIDRGEDGIKTLQWMMMQPNVELILGNHEAMLLSCKFIFDEIDEDFLSKLDSNKLSLLQTWQFNGAAPTLKELTKLSMQEREFLLEYLNEAPLYDSVCVNGKDYLLTHSGLGHFNKNKRISEYTPDELLWNRPQMDTYYFDDITVVFGHTPTVKYGKQYAGKTLKTPTWINIDTGAGCGYSPTLLCLDNMEEYHVEDNQND